MINKKSILDTPFVKTTRTHYSHGVIMKPHAHSQIAISLVLKGNIQETVDNTTGLGGIGNIVVKPVEAIHNNMFSNDCTIISIYLKEIQKNRVDNPDLLKEWSLINGADSQQYFKDLMLSKSRKQYYTALNSLVNYIKHRKTKTINFNVPEWLKEVKLVLDTSYDEVIRTKDLSSFCNVHPVYLSRAFKKYFGQSIKSYLKTLRINSAMADIVNQEDSLVQIAIKNGFSDQSHFNRSFTPKVGLTPSQFRNLTK